jgi:hypothetical protein
MKFSVRHFSVRYFTTMSTTCFDYIEILFPATRSQSERYLISGVQRASRGCLSQIHEQFQNRTSNNGPARMTDMNE